MRIKEGDIIGNFSVLHLVARRGSGLHRRFLVRCNPCGKELEKNTNDIKKQISCGCLHYKTDRRLAISQDMYNHLKHRHKPYKGFIISFDTFLRLSESLCTYCGNSPSNISKDLSTSHTWLYNGIDRIDSNYGYIEGNVQACCKICNVAKSDLSHQEFLGHIERIFNYSFKDWGHVQLPWKQYS